MSKAESPTELSPPYGNITWYKKFFDIIRTRSFTSFDKKIIELNIIKRANATMLFNGLRFLGLVEEDGNVTEKFESLRRKGEEFKQNLKKVVEEAYKHLFTNVVISKAKPENLINYFMECYNYGENAAKRSTEIFIYLCQEAGIPLSSELTEGSYKAQRAKRTPKPKGIVKDKGSKKQATTVPKDMHEIKWHDEILILLKKGNKKTKEKIAKTAKKLIDMYVEEIEEEE